MCATPCILKFVKIIKFVERRSVKIKVEATNLPPPPFVKSTRLAESFKGTSNLVTR